MVRFATPNDIEELKKMWHNIFKDDLSYINLFFENVFQCDNTLVYEVDDTLASMIYMVDYQLVQEQKCFEIVYLYALATKPEYRNKGIMEKLIKEAFELCKERKKDALMLIPGNKSLCNYYQHKGFATQIYTKTVKQSDGYIGEEIPFSDIKINNGIHLNESQLDFQKKLACLENLTLCKISNDNLTYQYKLCSKDELIKGIFNFDYFIMMKFITDFTLQENTIISLLLA